MLQIPKSSQKDVMKENGFEFSAQFSSPPSAQLLI